jgi:hypothetical protein
VPQLQVFATLISRTEQHRCQYYGFALSIHFYKIDPPLKKVVSSQPNLVQRRNSLPKPPSSAQLEMRLERSAVLLTYEIAR